MLGLLGLPWRASPADVDEDAHLLPDPAVAAINVALAKAHASIPRSDEIVVAADTLVVVDGEILGKPVDAAAAAGMLARLRGRSHDVLTGVALQADDGLHWCGVVDTRVVMRHYDENEVAAYVARGEPFDKAGGYAVQDASFRPVERLEGCFLNVVGLPLCAVSAGLRALGCEVAAAGAAPCAYCASGAELVSIRSLS